MDASGNGPRCAKYIDRMAQRRWKRHVILATGASAATAAIYLALALSNETWMDPSLGRKADDSLWRFNVATGSVAMTLLVITLSIGPLRVLGGGRSSVHLPWRRVTGVWATVFAVIHFPGGLAIHSEGWRIWGPFSRILPEAGNLIDSYGVAYWAGLGALALLVVLAATSRDTSLRKMGAQRWKRLHLLAYPALALVLIHAISMQYSERRNLAHAAITAGVLAVAVGLQLAGFLRTRRRATSTNKQPVR